MFFPDVLTSAPSVHETLSVDRIETPSILIAQSLNNPVIHSPEHTAENVLVASCYAKTFFLLY